MLESRQLSVGGKILSQGALRQELAVAIDLARQAGAAIMEYYPSGLAVHHKAGDEPVTAADHAADQIIVTGLRAAFPGDGLLTEESPDDRSRLGKDRVWIVDPLDGTTEFITRTGEFCVQIALTERGRPVLGVVFQPAKGRLDYAVRGQGAYQVCDGHLLPLRVTTTAEVSEMCLVASRSHYSPLIEAARSSLGISTVTRMGSVGVKVSLVARGACDLYLATIVSKEWDLCAPHALLLEAGGVLTNLCGEPLTYNKPDVVACTGLIASNGRAHEQIVAHLSLLRPLAETRT
jgi:3'(2'), 5'-bisphosphate nucleotidase